MAMHVAAMVDMAMSKEEKKANLPAPVADRVSDDDKPVYPWGLCLRLSKDELDKLKLSAQVGDTVHIFAMAKVTSASASASEEGGESRSLELQIMQMSAENEDAENETADEEEDRLNKRRGKWYDGPRAEEDY